MINKLQNYSFSEESESDRGWNLLLAKFRDATVYQTAEYTRVRMLPGCFKRFVLRNGGDVVSICVVRLYKLPFLKIGFGVVTFGPLWRIKEQSNSPQHAIKMMLELKKYISEELGLQLKISTAMYSHDEDGLVFENEILNCGFTKSSSSELTPVMSLKEELPLIRKNFDQKWRNRLNAAEKNDIHVTISNTDSDFNEFMLVYAEMRKRKQYRSSENVTQFRAIYFATEPIHRAHVVLCWKGSTAIAGAVISTNGETALYIYGAATEEGLKLQAANLLHWKFIEWAKSNGIERYDLMSVSQEAPWFKRGLCGKNGFDAFRLGPYVSSGGAMNNSIFSLAKKIISLTKK